MSKTSYNRIKSVLADQGKTNKDLADALGVNVVTVSNWCTNDSQPSVKMLFEIAESLDIDVRLLLVSNKR
jgi:transcriptional regulator with XRE-family HTH domain